MDRGARWSLLKCGAIAIRSRRGLAGLRTVNGCNFTAGVAQGDPGGSTVWTVAE